MSVPLPAESRVQRLRRLTRDDHAGLDEAVMARGIFTERARFARFVRMQYCFHADVAPLYARADLQAHVPDLAARARLAYVADDLRDLGVSLPESAIADMASTDLACALGWLYVVEGATLGAAVILKLAAPLGLHSGFGATHLAPAREGVAPHWRRFTQALDTIELPPPAEIRVIEGARAAFARARHHLHEAFL